MTRVEAINVLSANVMFACDRALFDIATKRCVEDALDMAIEALGGRKTGKWKPWKAYYGKDHKSWSDELKCSECGFKWGDEEYKFCPMCGTEMEEPYE